MKTKAILTAAAFAAGFCGCNKLSEVTMIEKEPVKEIKFITLDPGHFMRLSSKTVLMKEFQRMFTFMLLQEAMLTTISI